MAKAIWNGAVIAQSDDVVLLEGNVYFPADAVQRAHLQPSPEHTVCGWKGHCSYFDLVVGDQRNEAAAWSYLEPLPAAANIRGRIAFWKGVQVER